MINHCMYWGRSNLFTLRDMCSSSLSLVSLSEFKSRKEDGWGWLLTLCMHWHQPLTKAVKQTSKHTLRQSAHSLFPHPIPETFMLSAQWKSKHTRKMFPCKCEIHTGKRKTRRSRFAVHPKKTTLCKVLERQPDILLPFNYTANTVSTWQIPKDMTS